MLEWTCVPVSTTAPFSELGRHSALSDSVSDSTSLSSFPNKPISSRGRKWIRNSICFLYNLFLSPLLNVKKCKCSVHPPEMANSKCSVTNATYAQRVHSRSVRSAGRGIRQSLYGTTGWITEIFCTRKTKQHRFVCFFKDALHICGGL